MLEQIRPRYAGLGHVLPGYSILDLVKTGYFRFGQISTR